MDFHIRFPEQPTQKVAVTALMQQVATRTLAVHPGGALVAWTGRHRLGKTTTARWLRDRINERHDHEARNPDPRRPPFRAVHYEVGAIGNVPAAQRKAIRGMYHALIADLDEGLYRRTPTEELARMVVHGVRRKGIGMAFVDEAGLLSVSAIGGLVLVRDVAENLSYPFSIVLVGMDNLASKLMERPQIEGRVHEWCFFQEYELGDTWDFLAELHPHFRDLDRDNADHLDQVQFLHDTYGGVPGELVPFLRRLDAKARGRRIDLTLMKAVHLISLRDQKRAQDAERRGYRAVEDEEAKRPRRKPEDENEEPEPYEREGPEDPQGNKETA